MEQTHATFQGWVPMRISWRDAEPLVDWCYAGTNRFKQPFFRDSIQQLLQLPFNLVFRCQTSLDQLGELFDEIPRLNPTGFIFHMSRCGSTLVSQMLATLSRNIVISEAPPIDAVVSSDDIRGDRVLYLKWMVAALGAKRGEDEQDYYIKFDSWNTLDLELIRQAFPAVPWIFLYREPVEVIVSHMRERGSQMVPGGFSKLLPGVGLDDAAQMPAEEYCARALATICEAALEHCRDANALLVNYSELPAAVTTHIARHFGVVFTEAEISAMRDAALFNAKRPKLIFEPDSENKRADASDAALAAAAKWVDPLYRRLEKLRLEESNNDRDL